MKIVMVFYTIIIYVLAKFLDCDNIFTLFDKNFFFDLSDM